MADDNIILVWKGSLTWSAELMDRRVGLQKSMQFLGKAAHVAESASKLGGRMAGHGEAGRMFVTTTAAEADVKEPKIICFLPDVRDGER